VSNYFLAFEQCFFQGVIRTGDVAHRVRKSTTPKPPSSWYFPDRLFELPMFGSSRTHENKRTVQYSSIGDFCRCICPSFNSCNTSCDTDPSFLYNKEEQEMNMNIVYIRPSISEQSFIILLWQSGRERLASTGDSWSKNFKWRLGENAVS